MYCTCTCQSHYHTYDTSSLFELIFIMKQDTMHFDHFQFSAEMKEIGQSGRFKWTKIML